MSMKSAAVAVTLLTTFFAQTAQATFGRPPPRPEPPRFEVPEGASLPLRSTHHAVEVVGPVAHVTVTQVYVNTGSELLDATYIFPGSPASAVASLVMRIGERSVTAVLKKKEEARADFEAARRAGQRASLLEQRRANVFQMGLTNIRPGERVEVELGYTELLVPEGGQFELALPGVVAPRFGDEGGDLGAPDTLRPGAPAPRWSADIRLRDGLGVVEVSSPTHDVSPRVDPQGRVQVALDTPGDAEMVLRWRLASGRSPTAGLTFFEGQEENFFMMTVAPPKRVAADRVPPREIDFVLDVSCSMRGFPLDVAKVVMRESLERLRPSDRFNIHFFAGSGWTYADAPLPATRQNVQAALQAVSQRQGGGGTQLVQALQAVARLPRAPGLARSVVVVTDGLVSFERSAFAKVRERIEGTVFTLGIGANVNRLLVEGLARAGGGVAYVAHDVEAAKEEAKRLVENLRAPVMTDLKLTIDGLDAYELEPPTLPDLYADRPIVVVGKYRGPARGRLRLSGVASKSSFEQRLSASETQPANENAPLRALWARRHLQRVADDRALADGGATKETITAIGLKYGLLTDHTAFVAVDTEGGSAQGEKRSVVQASPHPKGMEMSSSAYQSKRSMAAPTSFGSMGVGRGGGGSGPVIGGVRASKPQMRRPRPEREALADAPTSMPPPQPAFVEEPTEKAKKDRQAPVPRLRFLAAIVQGPLDNAAVERTLGTARKRLSQVLARAKARGEAIPERLTLELRIGANGEVTSVKVLEASGAGWEREATKLLRGLVFSKASAASRVRWPMRTN